MNTKRAMKWSLLVAAAGCVAVATMPGCELLVTFDRSKIPDEGGMADATASDGQSTSDSVPPTETGPGRDAPATMDGGADAPAEVASGDAPTEASGGDAARDTSTADAPTDSGAVDVAAEAAAEGGADAAQEAAAEGGGADAADAGGAADAGSEAAPDSAAVDAPAESSADGSDDGAID